MGLFGILTTKPWETQGPGLELEEKVQPQRLALNFFMAVVSVVFGLFAVAYYVRMQLDDWRPTPEPILLWVNTVALFIASLCLQILVNKSKTKNSAGFRSLFALGALLTVGFVYGQVFVWQQLLGMGFQLYLNPAAAFFYVLTGLHAMHILGGLFVWLRAGVRLFSGCQPEEIRMSVELCARYWHFLLILWLLLFALLANT